MIYDFLTLHLPTLYQYLKVDISKSRILGKIPTPIFLKLTANHFNTSTIIYFKISDKQIQSNVALSKVVKSDYGLGTRDQGPGTRDQGQGTMHLCQLVGNVLYRIREVWDPIQKLIFGNGYKIICDSSTINVKSAQN